mgnify:CR=1 FL=1
MSASNNHIQMILQTFGEEAKISKWHKSHDLYMQRELGTVPSPSAYIWEESSDFFRSPIAYKISTNMWNYVEIYGDTLKCVGDKCSHETC